MSRLTIITLLVSASGAYGQSIDVTNLSNLELGGSKAEVVTHRGKKAVKLTEPSPLVMLKGVKFTDGTIEAEIAGEPSKAAGDFARGFVGLAFRVQGDRYECFYIRPTNGRADDQVRRNHSVQYVAHPDYPWMRLRKEFPEKYETYVDLEPGVWTRIKIVVSGTRGLLYVHGVEQPTLIVNDLKLGNASGGIGLWAGPGADCYYRDLRITAAR